MDIIAQKLSAQEVIQANLKAEASELQKLQVQVNEYERILETLKQVDIAKFDVKNIDITDIMEQFVVQVKAIISTIEIKQDASPGDILKRQEYLDMQQTQLKAIERIIEENFAMQRAKAEADERIRREAERAKEEAERAREEAERAREEADERIRIEAEKLRAEADEKIRAESERAKAEAEKAKAEAEIAKLEADEKIKLESGIIKELEEIEKVENLEADEESLREFIHVESVKVYRNVQAVVVQGLKDQAKKTQTSETNILEEIKTLKTFIIAVGILLALDFIIDGVSLVWTILGYLKL